MPLFCLRPEFLFWESREGEGKLSELSDDKNMKYREAENVQRVFP